MTEALFTRVARADLDDALTYAKSQWNDEQGTNYVRALHRVSGLLAQDPAMGHPIDGVREGYMKFPVGLHMIYYRKQPGTVEIVRVLHKSMDVE